jgi:acetylornithine deacetylase/succinyl-diaminopimelate desuccinylase-like protein
VPGFYDRVRPLSDQERRELAALPFDEAEWSESIGLPRPAGEAGYSTLERVWARPTLDVNGMVSGYTGEGSKTIVPARATAKLSCRLVPDQQPDEITELVAARLRELAPDTVRVEVTPQHGATPVLIDRGHPAVPLAARAYELGYGVTPVFTREGGSVPVVELLRRVLGVEVLLLGFGLPDQNEHAPNEYLSLTNFARGSETITHFWQLLSGADLTDMRGPGPSHTPKEGKGTR